MSRWIFSLLALTAAFNASAASDADCPAITVRQVDASRFPLVRVRVLLTDAKGEPLRVIGSDTRLQILENDKVVDSKLLAGEQPVYTVLTLDVSGSMGGKLGAMPQAQKAALRYVREAPPSHRIALVTFGNQATVVADFDVDRRQLGERIFRLKPAGFTALQDGVGKALELLTEKQGRKVVLLLTDGREQSGKTGGSVTYAGSEGRAQLVEIARKRQVSIDTIGLGRQVDVAGLRYLSDSTRGIYRTAAQAEDLSELFSASVRQLARELTFEYQSRSVAAGQGLQVSAIVIVGDKVCSDGAVPKAAILPGLIPNVRGYFAPYIVTIFILLMLPWAIAFAGTARDTSAFRNSHYVVLQPGSPQVGKKEPGLGPNDPPFAVGDHVIVAPTCGCPHFVRSWRFAKCHCMRHPASAGKFCYVRAMPPWARSALDKLFGGHAGNKGRLWQCSCAGDKEGY